MRPIRRNKKPESKPPAQKGNYAFIDSQNLNLGVQKVGWKMDWRKFRAYLADVHKVERAYMFIGYMPENEKLYDQMHELGYLIVLKPTLDMFHIDEKIDETDAQAVKDKKAAEDKRPATKGNVDAELVLYAVKEMPNYNKAVVVSGDGDFYGLVEYLVEQNKLDSLLAPNWQYSSLLKPFDKYIIRLDQKRRELSYHSFKKPAAKK